MRTADGRVRAFWCRTPSRPNFGDALTPWLLRKMTGRVPEFAHPDDPRHKYFVVGSTVSYVRDNATVWGAGILRHDDDASPAATYRSVRGPLTRRAVLRAGGRCPEVYGDPALLLPRFHQPAVAPPTGRVALVAHYADLPRVAALAPADDDVMLVDIQSSIEAVIDELARADVVASSSLHGVVVAHAYGVPAVWVTFGEPRRADAAKFEDHFLSVGMTPPRPLRIDVRTVTAAQLRDHAVPAPTTVDVSALLDACPIPTPSPT